ncbi:AraC family transcriptional regulator [Aliifodinibius sp. S!AR15-10]|uniref:helix-turn-helix domain-containing protein n=1 Tax=Aliifodinibius sp. S!AR15-10 TaxID=2950437 RepID=UPI00285D74F9|nr:AraC family transcriptional regulator [Aliifodinibius sp. S!AR15-10]MDR8390781.1 AraC family transcriptional regulator [Aliifodinibius sp. S!AR15-10]
MDPIFKKNVDAHHSFKLKNTVGQSFDGMWHFHKEYELIYIFEGRGEKIIGDHVSDLQKGDLLFLGSDLPHLFSCDQDFPFKEQSGSLVIHLNSDFFSGQFLDIPEFKPIHELIKLSKSGIEFYGDTKQISERILHMFELNPADCILDILSILNHLSSQFESKTLASPGYTSTFSKKDYQRINKACQYVMDHYQEDISLDDVIEIIGLTKAAFCRHFKKVTGKTFFTYIKQYRIGQACRLLMETNLNVTEISYRCGFNTISNFNKQFKTVMNANPSTYRERFENQG